MSARCAIATAMEGVHYVLHAPQGDTYADLLFTMIERRSKRPPVTYTTFQARDLGGDTAELFKTAARDAYERFRPQALLVGASCTAELIQDDPGGLARALNLPIPVVALELPVLSAQGKLGRVRDVLSACPRARRATRAAAWHRPGAGAALQPARPDRAWLPPSRRSARDHRAAGASRGRGGRHRAARCDARRPRAAGRGRFQRRAVSRDRRPGGAMAAAQLRPEVHPHGADRRRRDARVRGRGGRTRWNRCACGTGRRFVPPAVVFALGRLELSHRQAGFRVRRRDACHRGRAGCQRGTRFHRGRPRHLQPRIRPRGARGGEAVRRRAADRRRLPRHRGEASPRCSRSWCSARRWSGTSPSGWAFPAR